MITKSDVRKELEIRIIGTILSLESIDDQMSALIEIGNENIFINEDHRAIIREIAKVVVKERIIIDPVILFDRIKRYASEIAAASSSALPNIDFLKRDVTYLKTQNYHSSLINDLARILEKLKNVTSIQEIESIKNEFIVTLSSQSFGKRSMLMNFNELDSLLMNNLSKEKTDRIDGYSFGISDLDMVTNGIIPGKLYTVGALKKSGKTRFVMHVIKELYRQKITTATLSLEVPDYNAYQLLKSTFAGIEDQKLRTGYLKYLNKEEIERLVSIQFDEELLMIECNSGLNLSDVLHRIRKYSKMGAKVFMIDFFQRIVHDINNKVNALEEIAQRLADAAKEHNIAIFILSQLSNIAEKETPTISHLKGTGGLAEASDTIMVFDNVFRRTGDKNFQNRIDVEITQRYGESAKISLYADLGKCFFANYHKVVNYS